MLNKFIAYFFVLISLPMALLSSACSQPAGQSLAPPAGIKAAGDSAMRPSVGAAVAPQRFIIVLLDVSKSFLYLQKAQPQIDKIVAALGPGDTVLIAVIAGAFDPAHSILIERTLPDIPAACMKTPLNLREQNERQAALNMIWQKVEGQKQEILEISHKVALQVLSTDLHTALAYAAQRFAQAGDVQKQLLLFTDMEQDVRGVKTTQPPSASGLSLKAVQVQALFVPWHDANAWQQLAQAWAGWGAARGAQNFTLHDPGQSAQLQLLAPSAAPKTVPPVFARDRN